MKRTLLIAVIAVVAIGLASFAITSAITGGRTAEAPPEAGSSAAVQEQAGQVQQPASSSDEGQQPAQDSAGGQASYAANAVVPYLAVLEEYSRAMPLESLPDGLSYVNPEAWVAQKDWVDVPLSYGFVDLASDGSPELVVAYNFGAAGNGSGTSGGMSTYRLYDLYGIADGHPVRLVDAASLGYRAIVSLYADGYVKREGSSGATDITAEYYRLAADSAELEFLESVRTTEGGKTFTFADGSSQVTALSEDLLTQTEHFSPELIVEGIEWHLVSDYEAAFNGQAPTEDEAGQETYYFTMLTRDHIQAAGFSGNTFEITARFATGVGTEPSYADISSTLEQLNLELIDGTRYYGTGGTGGPEMFDRAEAEQMIASNNGLGLMLKMQDGVLLEMRFAS